MHVHFHDSVTSLYADSKALLAEAVFSTGARDRFDEEWGR